MTVRFVTIHTHVLNIQYVVFLLAMWVFTFYKLMWYNLAVTLLKSGFWVSICKEDSECV